MRVEQAVFPSGERLPMLLDDDDLPVPEACEWFLRRRHLALQTLMRNSGEVLIIHRWAHKRRMNIHDRIRSGKQEGLAPAVTEEKLSTVPGIS